MENIASLFTQLIKLLVDRPEDVEIMSVHDGARDTLEVTVRSDEIGKIIGKQGRTAKSLRNLMHAINLAQNMHVRLNIIKFESKTKQGEANPSEHGSKFFSR